MPQPSKISPTLKFLLTVPLLGFLILLGVLWGGLGNDPSLLPSVLVNQPLPAFQASLVDKDAQQINHNDLIQDQQGEIALLNIWATWCPTCRAEHEFLNGLKNEGVVIYGVNYKDERTKAIRWLTELGNPYRLNINDSDGQLGIDLGVYGAPETFLLDGQGVIRYRHVGALDATVWQQQFLPRIQQIKSDS